MKTINERLMYLRKEVLKLTQTEFGEKIGLSKPVISLIENGKNDLTERNIKFICKEFNVSIAWLKEGIGDIFNDLPEFILDELIDQYDLDELDRKIIKKYLELDEDHRQIIKDFIISISEE